MESVMGSPLLTIVMLLAAVLLLVIFAVFALARQIGILHTRLAPAGALMTTAGPKVGQPSPVLSIPDINGIEVPIGMPSKLAQLVLFVSPTCPICKDLVPIAKDMAKADRVNLVFASDGGERTAHDEYIKRMKLEKYPYIVSLELGMKFEVGKLPYAVLIDSAGVLRSKGLVNSREHLESLVLAMQSGYESIQDYLVKEGRIGDPA